MKEILIPSLIDNDHDTGRFMFMLSQSLHIKNIELKITTDKTKNYKK